VTFERLVIIDADGTRTVTEVDVVAEGPRFLTARIYPYSSSYRYIDKATIASHRPTPGSPTRRPSR
jgi:hypothetical protein